jgi:hypothetical protein
MAIGQLLLPGPPILLKAILHKSYINIIVEQFLQHFIMQLVQMHATISLLISSIPACAPDATKFIYFGVSNPLVK